VTDKFLIDHIKFFNPGKMNSHLKGYTSEVKNINLKIIIILVKSLLYSHSKIHAHDALAAMLLIIKKLKIKVIFFPRSRSYYK
jgi:hypothetical protein